MKKTFYIIDDDMLFAIKDIFHQSQVAVNEILSKSYQEFKLDDPLNLPRVKDFYHAQSTVMNDEDLSFKSELY